MATRSKKGIIVALIAWVVVLVGIALAWRLLVAPYFAESAKERQEQQQEALIASTSAAGSYQHSIELHADGFSGYAVLRSPELRNLLKNEGIRLEVVDDGADYPARVRSLKSGQAQFAAFPINSYLQAGAGLGEFPATILFIIDETQGADAMLAWKTGLENLQGLNNEKARVFYTPDSPSEFLAEITVESFILPKLPEDWRVKEEGSEKILRMMLNADRSAPQAYVMWEPQVSEALENPDIHVLLDSSKTQGYILDALVVERGFLKNHPEVVMTFAESYFRALYAISTENRMVELVRQDAGGPGRELPEKFAENIVDGIEWKNTTDNYAYFGLKNTGGGETLEDVIGKIAKVMVQAGLISADPLNGKYALIYYDKVLEGMRTAGFHPGKQLDVIAGDLDLTEEQASTRQQLRALSESQWEGLNPVAAFQVEEIRFPRMSDKITLQNHRKLQALASRLKDWPSYYITIIGQSQKSDMQDINEIAQDLALRRANAAADYLKEQGIPSERLRTQARLSEADDWSALNLVFEAGQIPY